MSRGRALEMHSFIWIYHLPSGIVTMRKSLTPQCGLEDCLLHTISSKMDSACRIVTMQKSPTPQCRLEGLSVTYNLLFGSADHTNPFVNGGGQFGRCYVSLLPYSS